MKIKMMLASFVFALCASANAGFMAVANVTKIHGTAVVKTATYEEKLKEGAEIAEGMTVKILKPKDYIEVKFQNGHIIRFTGATVKVEDITPKSTLFNLIKGQIFSAIKPLTEGETFKIKTTRASFAVRGTHFMVEESKKQTYLCVCDGVVSAKGKKGEVDVKKDEDFTMARSSSKLKATVAAKSMIDMTNAVFKDMNAL